MSVEKSTLFKFHPFSELAPEYIERIANASELHSVAKGKIVFQRGKSLPNLYYLVDGDISLVDASFESASLSAQDAASQFALNELNPSKASAVAASNVTILAVERRQLDLIMAASESSPELEVSVSGNLVGGSMVTEEINYLDAYTIEQSQSQAAVEQQDWMSRLLDSPLFNSVPAANIQKLFTRFESVSLEAGETIVEEGQEGDYFYVLASGSAKVIPATGDIVPLETGDYFGEEALVGDTTRNATVLMTTKGVAMRLSKGDFITLLQEPLFRYVELEQLPDFEPQLEILDVRLPVEHRHFSVRGSKNIALRKLRSQLKALDPGLTYVITDDGGSRSKVAVQLMVQSGLSAVILNNSNRGYPQ